MTQKELNKLRKPEMLRIMLEQQRQIEQLKAELAQANDQLAARQVKARSAGSIAEASLAITGIFEEAQKAADGYLASLKAQAEGESDDPDPLPAAPAPDEAPDMPSLEVIEDAVAQAKYRRRFRRMLRSTIFTLITVSAVAVLIAVLLLPVLKIYGSSMMPSLEEGDYVLSVKGGEMDTGDIVAFYYNNKVLIKRVIGQAGQWIDIDQDGNVYVDNVAIDEPYLDRKAFGECDIELPYQVPEARVFVMGDNRDVSVDSRSTTVGCVAEEQLVGKVVFCIWPLNHLRSIH
jgi:signal peptidase I